MPAKKKQPGRVGTPGPGQPRLDPEGPLVTSSLQAPGSWWEAFRKLAKKDGKKLSAVLREALEEYLKRRKAFPGE